MLKELKDFEAKQQNSQGLLLDILQDTVVALFFKRQ
jgi:hypothetical protein